MLLTLTILLVFEDLQKGRRHEPQGFEIRVTESWPPKTQVNTDVKVTYRAKPEHVLTGHGPANHEHSTSDHDRAKPGQAYFGPSPC